MSHDCITLEIIKVMDDFLYGVIKHETVIDFVAEASCLGATYCLANGTLSTVVSNSTYRSS